MDDNTTATTTTATQQGAGAAQNAATNTATEGATGAQNAAQEGNQTAQQADSRLEDLVQRAVDRATNKLGNENKKLRDQIKQMERAKLSDDEVKALELKEKDAELTERERALTEKENRLIAIKAIKEIGLDDGSNAALDLVDFVMADDEETIKGRIKVFDALVKRFVKAEVDRAFKSNGRTPGVGNTAAADGDNKKDSVAVQLGKNAANANKTARSTLDYYLGGK